MGEVYRDQRQNELFFLTIVLPMLALFFVILRFAARYAGSVPYGFDDGSIVIATILLFANMAMNLTLIYYGLGRHAAELDIHQLIMIGKILMAYECIYCTTVGIIKLSSLLMYRRILSVKNIKTTLNIIGFCVVAWTISIICVSIFRCTPIQKIWDPSLPGHCINLKGSFIGNGIPNIITDVIILSLPGYYLWNVQADKIRRILLTCIFILGGFVIFASVYRFITLFQFDEADISWTLATACTWCVVETATGIICTCLPTFRPLFRLLFMGFGRGRRSYGATATGSRLVFQPIDSSGLGFFQRAINSSNPMAVTSREQKVNVEYDEESEDEIPLHAIRVIMKHGVECTIQGLQT